MGPILGFIIAACCGAPASGHGLVSGAVERLPGLYAFTEGPVWRGRDGLFFTDIPADAIMCLKNGESKPFRQPGGYANGLAVDPQGRLLTCEHSNRRVTRTEPDGTITVVADQYLGRKLNSPNDVAVRGDGTVFFTDPPYGLDGRPAELPFSGVYAVTPGGQIVLLSVYFKTPNGIALSPDEKTLYVSDSKADFIQAFALAPDGALGETRLFCRLPKPDGLKTDDEGRIWATSEDGVRVYRPDGTLLETIPFPEQPSNCAFGDEDGKTLYVTARTGVYKTRCAAPGAHAKK